MIKYRLFPVLLVLILGACEGQISPRPGQGELKQIAKQMPLKIDWVKPVSSRLVENNGGSHLVINQNGFIASDGKNKLNQYSFNDAKLQWSADIEGGLNGSLMATDKYIYAVTDNADVFKLDRATGKRVWRGSVSSESLVAPVVGKGVVIIHSNDGNITALRDDSGDQLWVYSRSLPTLSLRGTATPLISGDVVIAGLASGKVVTLSIYDGKLIWETALSVPKGRSNLERMVDLDGEILLHNDVIYVGGFQGRVAALAMDSGRILWSRELSTPYGLVMSADKSTIFLTDDNGDIWSLDRATGATIWRQDALRGRISTHPATQGEFLIMGDRQDNLFWINQRDGVVAGQMHYYDLMESGGAWAVSDVLTDGYAELDAFPQPRGVAGMVGSKEHMLVSFRNGMVASLKTNNP